MPRAMLGLGLGQMCDVHRLWRTPGCRRRVMGPFWAVETYRAIRTVA